MLAVNLLKEEQFGRSLELLRRGEALAENNDHGLAMTYNNLACYYRK